MLFRPAVSGRGGGSKDERGCKLTPRQLLPTRSARRCLTHQPTCCPMATPPGGGRFPSHGDFGVYSGPPFSSSRRRLNNEMAVKEVIDLSASSPEPCSTATGLLAGAKLSEFTIGDRLGATRDGGEGFQVHHLLWMIPGVLVLDVTQNDGRYHQRRFPGIVAKYSRSVTAIPCSLLCSVQGT